MVNVTLFNANLSIPTAYAIDVVIERAYTGITSSQGESTAFAPFILFRFPTLNRIKFRCSCIRNGNFWKFVIGKSMVVLKLTITPANGVNHIVEYSNLETATSFSHFCFVAPFVQLWIVRFNTSQTFTPIVAPTNLFKLKFQLFTNDKISIKLFPYHPIQ